MRPEVVDSARTHETKSAVDFMPGKLFRCLDPLMKIHVFALFISAILLTSASADIQDPPSNDYGPTRKLGRGLGNFLFGGAEIPVTVCNVNKEDGNAAATSYGVVRGV